MKSATTQRLIQSKSNSKSTRKKCTRFRVTSFNGIFTKQLVFTWALSLTSQMECLKRHFNAIHVSRLVSISDARNYFIFWMRSSQSFLKLKITQKWTLNEKRLKLVFRNRIYPVKCEIKFGQIGGMTLFVNNLIYNSVFKPEKKQ